MAKDFESLKQQALVIKNEVEDGANSSERVGGILEDMLDYNEEKRKELSNKTAGVNYLTCETAASTAVKTVSITGLTSLTTGIRLLVKMTNNNTASNATLNINSLGAKPLYYDNERASSDNSWEAGEVIDVYYDGTNFYAGNVQGGNKAEKVEFDNSDTTFESENVQGALEEVSKSIEEHSNEIDICKNSIQFDLSENITFSSIGGYINANNGSIGGSSNTDCTNEYIQISSYNYINITLPSSSTNREAGIAFYDSESNFISGFVAPNTGTMKFDEYTIKVPEGAKSFRTTKWNDNVMSSNAFEFKCIAFLNMSEKINGIEDDIITFVDKSEEVSISRNNKFIAYKNGSIMTTDINIQVSENYINVEGVEEIQVLAFHSNNSSTSTGYAFYDSDKKYIYGGTFISDSEENKSGMETIQVPKSASYFRYTIYNKEIYLSFKQKIKDLINIKESNEVDLTGRSEFFSGNFYVNYKTGDVISGSASSRATAGYININGFKRLKTLLLKSSSSSTEAGMAFFDSSYNFISSIRAQQGSEMGNIDITVNVPENASYFANTIYDSNNGNYDFYYLIGYKDENSSDSEEQQEDNSKALV